MAPSYCGSKNVTQYLVEKLMEKFEMSYKSLKLSGTWKTFLVSVLSYQISSDTTADADIRINSTFADDV